MNRFKLFISSLFPKRCAYCGKIIAGDKTSCEDCRNNLPLIKGKLCIKCGREKSKCTCKGHENYYDGICAPFYFSGNVRKGVHRFKFRNSVESADEFAFQMSETVSDIYNDIVFNYITEVPITDKAKSIRGYNQSSIIAEKISRRLEIEYKPNVIKKIYETQKQHNLSFYLRKGNLTGVFDIPEPEMVKDKTILLVDDISTTGETLNECSKMLWLNGAKAVYCVTIALTELKKR